MIFESNGYRIYYEQYGAGRDIVLLHGWGGRIDSFKPLIRDFSAEARITVLDFPGHGKSSLPPEPWSVTEYAQAVACWMESIGISNADIIAHSFGGRVAIVLAATYPNLVGKLVLTGVPVPGLVAQKISAKQKMRSCAYSTLKKLCSEKLLGKKTASALREKLILRFGSADYRALVPEMRPTFNRIIHQKLDGYLPSIQSSALLVWGDKDTAATIETARAMERVMKDAGLVVFENADHFAYLHEYMRFKIVVHKFLLEK